MLKSTASKLMSALYNLPKVLESAKFLADTEVLKPADVDKCVRVYLSKHPEINEHLKKISEQAGYKVSITAADGTLTDAVKAIIEKIK